MKKGKVLIGVLAGMAAGAALGLLFAPNSGSETRKKLSKKSKDMTGAVNETLDKKFDELVSAITGQIKRPRKQHEPESAKMN